MTCDLNIVSSDHKPPQHIRLCDLNIVSYDHKPPQHIVLCEVNIVSSDSITFKKTKSLYIPFKAELAAIHWCLTKVDYDCHGARRIILKCDTKGHEIILEY